MTSDEIVILALLWRYGRQPALTLSHHVPNVQATLASLAEQGLVEQPPPYSRGASNEWTLTAAGLKRAIRLEEQS